MGIGTSSNLNETKPDREDITFCVICYENDIKTQMLDCGHAFCCDCILSIYEYEEFPRCPLCRQYICAEGSKALDEYHFKWFKIGRKSTNLLAVAVSCCILFYNILPMLQGYIQDWDLTNTDYLMAFA